MSNEQLSTTIQIRVSPSHAQRLSEAAALAGIPLSEYLRRKLRETNEVAQSLELMREAVASLRTMHDIQACVTESLILSRQNTLDHHIVEAHKKMRMLGILPYELG